MGACDFYTRATGKTAQEAFASARESALWEEGHGGYTGTIAEKYNFTMITVPDGVKPIDHAYDLIEKGDPRVSEKRGPAGCIQIEPGKFLFFGLAAS